MSKVLEVYSIDVSIVPWGQLFEYGVLHSCVRLQSW